MSKERKGSALERIKDKLLRPALIASEYTISEYPLFLEHLLVGFADESIHSALVCPTGCDVESIVRPTVEVIRYPASTLSSMAGCSRRTLVESLRDFKPSVLHCLCQSKAALTRQLARRQGLSYLLTINTLFRRRMLNCFSLKHCSKIIVPAETIAANIAKLYPRFGQRITQINVGTFVAEKSGCFGEPGRLASIVTVYPSTKEAEFENLLGAVRHLLIEGYEFMLVIIGGGRRERQMRKLLVALGLSQVVISVPKLKPWRSILAAGDIFVQPWTSNTFNPMLLEAMSVGTAVAGCRGSVDDLIIDGQTAVVFDPYDELSITKTLKELLDRPELARKIAAGAQNYLRENHSVSKMVTDTLQAYREAVQ